MSTDQDVMLHPRKVLRGPIPAWGAWFDRPARIRRQRMTRRIGIERRPRHDSLPDAVDGASLHVLMMQRIGKSCIGPFVLAHERTHLVDRDKTGVPTLPEQVGNKVAVPQSARSKRCHAHVGPSPKGVDFIDQGFDGRMDAHKTGNTGNFPSSQPGNSYFPAAALKSYKGGMDVVRKLILNRLQDLGLGMAEVSLRIGRNETYLQQFLKRGSPRELHERERMLLAEILKVPEDELRGPSSPLPKRSYAKRDVSSRQSLIDVATRSPQKDSGAQRSVIPGAELFGGMDLPVFGTAQGGDGALIITDRPVDYVARPSVLLRVEDGYGMIVTGDSMDPVIKTGSTVLINPHLPPRVSDLCLFRSRSEDGTAHAAVKEYRGENEHFWKVRQYNPPKDFTLKKSDWQDRPQRIVGSYFT